ncbi:MAG: putative Ig domain-containing protein [Solirubrobacteraceae bacterium]
MPGLSLSADGSLSGTPTEAGSFSLTVTATGASGATQAQQNTITIAAAQTAG